MQAGFASVDITPAIGSHIPGGFSPRISTGVLDPLQATACVTTGDNGVTLAFVSVDAVSVPDAIVAAAREKAVAATGITARDICIAASHTHCGGPSNSVLGTDADPEYGDGLAEAIAAAVTKAWSDMVDVDLVEAGDTCPGWAFNRRWVLPDGSHMTNPGKGNPDIVRPAGPVDDELRVLAFRSKSGEWLGAIANFTCHSTVLWGTEFSADYAGYWRRAFAERTGNAAFRMVFLNGACGDINQIDFSKPDGKESGPEAAARMGDALADCAWNALQTASPTTCADCISAHDTIGVDYRVPSPEQLASDRALAKAEGSWTSANWHARDRILLAERLAGQTTTAQPVDVYRIGNTSIPAAPWQPFCEFGLRIREGIAGPTMIATFANGSCGYVPTPAAFEGGGYEPILCRGSCLAPDTGDSFVEGLLKTNAVLGAT